MARTRTGKRSSAAATSKEATGRVSFAREGTTSIKPAAARVRSRKAKATSNTVRPPSRLLATARPIALLGGMLGCVYAAVALATFNPLDPSFSRASGTTVTNAAGPLGAWIADLLFQVLGHGAWLVVPLAVVLALKLARRPMGGLVRVLGGLLLSWSVLGVIASLLPAQPGADFPAGGLVGEVSVRALAGLVGPAGTWIVLVGTSLAALPFVFPLHLEDLAAHLVGGVEGAAPWLGRLGLHMGKRAVGGVAAAGAAVAGRVRDVGWSGVEDEDLDEDDDDLDEEAGDGDSFEPVEPVEPVERSEPGRRSEVRPVPRPSTARGAAGPSLDGFLGAPDAGIGPRPSVGSAAARISPAGDRATAWNDGGPPRLAAGLETQSGLDGEASPSRTQASGRALVEASWEPTVLPYEDVRDTIPAVDMAGSTGAAAARASAYDLPSARASLPSDLPPSAPRATAAGAAAAPAAPRFLSQNDPDSVWDAPDPASLSGLRVPVASSAASSAASAAAPSAGVVAPSLRPAAARSGATRGVGNRRVAVTPGHLESGGANASGDIIADPVSSAFELPHLGLLDEHERDVARFDEIELQVLAQTLEAKLGDFGVKGEVVAIRPGPVVTTFEYVPAPGIKLSKISGLSDDIAMALKALRVRIVAPIPGKGVVGIEIPNKKRQTVWFRDLLACETFRKHKGSLPMALGKTVEGKPYIGNLSSMPHLLVGGTTGSGKSVGVNGMLLSMLYTRTPEELRLILIDPKMLEFELYRDIPHLLHPVVTEPKLASAALKWACVEMDERYRTLSRWGVRNITSFNKKIEKELEDWTVEKAWRYAPADWPGDEAPPVPKRMPYIVIVIDELADLMMVAAKDVEESIIRLAQKARAAGIHLIVATQRPSVNVITGLIKANMPSRVAFQVRTKVDGRTILDQNGAESLLGKGDMLFLPPGVSDLERLHGAFVTDDEVKRVTDFLRDQGSPHYEAQITADDEDEGTPLSEEDFDALYDVSVAYVCRQGKASASMIQREFKIGYNRAARILEFMEREGVVGPADGARPREVLVGSHAS